MDILILIVAFFTLVVTTAFFVYQILKDKKEMTLSVIPICEGRSFPTHWYVDIAACGNRSLSIKRIATLVLSDGKQQLQTDGSNPLIPGGNHRTTPLKPFDILVNKDIKGIYVQEITGKIFKLNRNNLRLLKKIASEYDKQIKQMKAG